MKFVIPLSALVDYKGLLIRATTLTFNKGEGIKWGFNQFGKMVKDAIINQRHLDLLSKDLGLKDGEILEYDLDELMETG